MVHDTRNPLSCCPRCYRAELGWRASRRPVFRYARADAAEAPLYYRVFHGDQAVATVSRTRRSTTEPYEVTVDGDGGGLLRAGTLQDARQLVGAAYTALWRGGQYTARGPVHNQ
ncbi:MAG: hypothetical protein AB1679_03880 [Actinomycetota bacterium]